MSLHLVSDLQANKERFITRVLETGYVWGLRSENGWAYCPSNCADTNVLLFRSDEAYAKRHATKEWSSYVATPIELNTFVETWLEGMHQDGLLVGVNFNSELAGLEVSPVELVHDLAKKS